MAQPTCPNQNQNMNPADRTAVCSDCGRNLVILASGYFRSHKRGSAKLAAAAKAAADESVVVEKTNASESIIHAMHREYADAGYAVSLVGYDTTREVYAFDVTVNYSADQQ